jgi:hypothetical protein
VGVTPRPLPVGNSHSPRELYGLPAEATEVVLGEMGMSDVDLANVLSGPGGRHLGWVTRWTEDYAFAVERLGLCNFYQHALNIKVGRLAEMIFGCHRYAYE